MHLPIIFLALSITVAVKTEPINITNYKKCCGQGQILTGPPYHCKNETFPTSNFFIEHSKLKNNCIECIDELENTEKNKLHAKQTLLLTGDSCQNARAVTIKQNINKCCPFGNAYNHRKRSCQNSTLNVNFTLLTGEFIKFGLPECTNVIVDEFFDDEEAALNSTILESLAFEDFCVDFDVSENKFVVKKCLSRNICEGNRHVCVRKCCADGQSYIGGPTCYPIFKHGYNVTHKHIRNFKSK